MVNCYGSLEPFSSGELKVIYLFDHFWSHNHLYAVEAPTSQAHCHGFAVHALPLRAHDHGQNERFARHERPADSQLTELAACIRTADPWPTYPMAQMSAPWAIDNGRYVMSHFNSVLFKYLWPFKCHQSLIFKGCFPHLEKIQILSFSESN